MRDFIEEEFQVAGVADCVGHLSEGLGVIGGEDLLGEIAEMAHGKDN
jgi:hypothetical protein